MGIVSTYLVISHSRPCALREVRNVLDRLKHCCRTFLQSPKKNALLEKVVSNHLQDRAQRKALLDLCRTRWAERHSAYQHFYQSYVYIVETLAVIGHRLHLDTYEDSDWRDWDSDAWSEGQQLPVSITSFDFIVVFLTLYFHLSHLSGVTVKLQGEAVDIVAAHKMIGDITQVYSGERANVDSGFHKIYGHAVRMADKVGSQPSKRRSGQNLKQQHHSNAPAETIEEYYKRNSAIPFLDHVISNFESRCSSLARTASSLLCLVPSVISSEQIRWGEDVDAYEGDLPYLELVDVEGGKRSTSA